MHLRLPLGISAPSLVPGVSDDPGSLTQVSIPNSKLDIFGNDVDPEILSSTIDINPKYIHVCEGKYMHDDNNFLDEDALLDNTDLGNEGDHSISPSLGSLIFNTST